MEWQSKGPDQSDLSLHSLLGPISVLQIKRDKQDNLGIIFLNIPLKRML